MERDRGLSLLVQLAGRGLVDFKNADLRNPRWWSYLGTMMRHVENVMALEHLDRSFLFNVNKLTVPRVTDESFEEAQKTVLAHLRESFQLLFTWNEAEEEETMAKEARMLREAWIQRFGDPEDPEIQEKIQRTAEALRSMPTQQDEQAKVRQLRDDVKRKADEVMRLVQMRRAARRRGLHSCH